MKNTQEINFQLIFESLPGLNLILMPNFSIAAASDAYANATMTKREEILGKHLFDIFPDNPDDQSSDGVTNLRASLNFVLKNKEAHSMHIQKYDIRKPDGTFEERYWSPLNKPVLNSKQEVVYIIHRVEDVTEFVRIKNEQAQKDIITNELQARLKEAEIEIFNRATEIHLLLEQKVITRTEHLNEAKLEIEKHVKILSNQKKQLEDFCNIISHNLRGPLVNISLLVDFISRSQDEEEKKILTEKLCTATEHLNEIFNQFIESLQIKEDTEIKSEKLILRDYLQKVLDGLQVQIDQSQAVIQINFDETPEIYFPPRYLISIFYNLISNSIKYKSPDRIPTIKLVTEKLDEKIILKISDNGLGIDLKRNKHNLFKIRKVFHSNPDAKGFGLFITKSQVEAMGGQIWAESIPEKGSTFYIEFINQNL